MMIQKALLSLDLGDKWIGVALADQAGISCRPLTTLTIEKLVVGLKQLIHEYSVSTIIVGLPKTLSGTSSEQTKKIITKTKELKKKLEELGVSTVHWKLWDERLSSKRAESLSKNRKSFEEKKKEHARAAAFILQSYLDSLAFEKENQASSTQEL